MPRNGSPFEGTMTIALKEAADHLASIRMHLVMLLVLLTAFGAIYGAIGQIEQTVGQDPFLFLRLLTTAKDPVPSFVTFLGFLLPLVSIALAFDSVNGEYSRRTMSRILSQPIYRDALLFGKFLGGLIVLAICLVTLWLLVTGMGILTLGLPPSGEEILRGLGFLVTSLAYGGVWLALGLFFSTVFRQAATSALAALALWLVFAIFWGMITHALTLAIAPIDPTNPMTLVNAVEWQSALDRISPNTLYSEAAAALLNPSTRSLGLVFLSQMQGAIPGAPLPLGQSLVLIWPQLSGLAAAMVLIFTLGYVSFQRQEVRA
ncbi:ABC-type transport system involved in multi-copper enzyme maturation, permease component [Hartmannibacter diazotrophicus]|uniref:ABC-type transport system involved in multi-copper enzyme maturation, permease component n=1 Tax=Hartmannibacter diazotrophicus TaxID=1482074 RepID=A0A2C9DDJ1_9HYPH|nr:ABC transporter permease [Hartmannibacter diazotrophicus]SON58402.1 ABC-type transport system involved in multi-copper enzyme maturation, permease component [Hartmannibacter diazotrophicus]